MADEDAQSYYARGPEDLDRIVLDALSAAGRPTDPIDPDDLAGLDEFHGLGRAATLALAEVASIPPRADVLDIGGGIGGPARAIARHCEARVTALDPTARFCALAEELNRRTGVGDAVEVVRGDARSMPFEDGSFDIAITQAVWPSIEAKPAMLSEARRVLRPGGKLAIYEAVEGPEPGPPDYPLPWADGPAEDFLVSAERIRELTAAAGFETVEWIEGAEVLGRVGEHAAAAPTGLEGVDLSLLMPDFEARMGGIAGNIVAGRIQLAIGIFTR